MLTGPEEAEPVVTPGIVVVFPGIFWVCCRSYLTIG